MGGGEVVLALLVFPLRVVVAGVGLLVHDLEPLVDQIAFLVLPLGVGLLDALDEDAGAVLVVEVVLFEGEHLVLELLGLVLPLQVLLDVQNVLDVLIEDVHAAPPLPDYLVYRVGIEVGLRGRKTVVQSLLDPHRGDL